MDRLWLYASGFVAWIVLLVMLMFGYGIINAVAWNIGVGDDLVASPWAPIHHRIISMGTWFEGGGEGLITTMQSAEAGMASSDVSAAQREAERQRYEAARNSYQGFLIKTATGVIASYLLLVVLPIEVTRRWRKRPDPPVSHRVLT
ncbi:hypothetical protein [Nitrolancea hollandica]|uniref:Uncharacterized protein n=1 Tax=Nitrolancea hollandica Lb TaxID=1129897 RepID=I4EKG1_9BACT|nr:hypothetical protein [Nitrolancea hollandica]CCF85173.1 hypothetical protein NITHO_460009 [Nitrolancea hollandica Lb]